MKAPAAARVGGGTIELAPVPEPPEHPKTVELRLALVCYGGVSLAIYMHGVTKEIQKLVAASTAYEEDQERCPWADSHTEYAYWHALKALEREGGLRTRVVVDIIAGTSAGGINGIVLAKALAHDLDQQALREVWLERGDISQLLALPVARRMPFLPLKIATWALWSSLKKHPEPPLDGDRMFKWILEALESMDESRSDGRSLMPALHPLELYVTVTDIHGYNRRVPTFDPKRVTDLRHRHALVFGYGPGRDDLDGNHNPELAFAARATSCFPGAFPPINLANIEENVPGWDQLESFKRSFWSIYELSDARVEGTHFIDGGVLDNFPFGHAIEAIRARPAALEVDRRLVYIEPHPKDPKPHDAMTPTLSATVWGGLAGIPRQEPVLDDLLAIRQLNERVDRVSEIVDSALPAIAGLALNGEAPASYSDANSRANEVAAEHAGFAHASYVQLKLYSVVRRFSELASRVCALPLDSNQAFLVTDALVAWARERKILESAIHPSARQREFLRDFDLDYAERRIRFVIRYLNTLYDEDAGRPPRGEVNAAKKALYDQIKELAEATAEAGGDARGEAVRALFARERLRELLDSEEPPDKVVGRFIADHGDEIDAIEKRLRKFFDQRLNGFGAAVYERILSITEGWDPEVQRTLRARYLGFPLWDVLIFPLLAVADVGEFNRVEVIRFSPEDVERLKVPGQAGERPTAEEKLKGVAAGHFAAFFSRAKRENDYLWGRLDAAERILGLLLEKPPPISLCDSAFGAILDQEEPELGTIRPLFVSLRSQLERNQPTDPKLSPGAAVSGS